MFFRRWARVLRLFAMVGVIIAVLVLASYDILESVRQVSDQRTRETTNTRT